jgi:hypothetical protein
VVEPGLKISVSQRRREKKKRMKMQIFIHEGHEEHEGRIKEANLFFVFFVHFVDKYLLCISSPRLCVSAVQMN